MAGTVSEKGEKAPILVTGASGFLGRRIVAAARAAGHPVRAVLRDPAKAPAEWEGLEVISCDLSVKAPPAETFAGAGSVIHAAAGQGDDTAHARDTIQATKALIGAMQAVDPAPRLVLVSSFSVYGYAALPDGATLDELAPVETDTARRDAYARAKLAQEAQAIAAAQTGGLTVRLIRPGAIHGPGRTGTARLGWRGGRICPGGEVPVPAVHVDHVARALVAAATKPFGDWPDDWPIRSGAGRIDTINVVDPDTPTQRQWLEAAGQGAPRVLPRGLLMKLAKGLDLAGALWPGLGRRLPAGLSEPALSARFKPLRYSAARAEDRLDIRPEKGFSELMREARR